MAALSVRIRPRVGDRNGNRKGSVVSSDRPDPPLEADNPTPEQPDSEELVTDRFHLGALRVMEEGPYAPQCPHGHGRLVAAVDAAVATGVSLSCPTCGFQRELAVNMLRNIANQPSNHAPRHAAKSPPDQATARLTPSPPRHAADPTAQPTVMFRTHASAREVPENDAPNATVAVDTPRPHGAKPDGTVRTCSGLEIHGWVTPAGLWSPLVALLVGLVFTGGQVLWSLLLAAVGYGLWWSATRWVWPCSLAVNRQRVLAEAVRPGVWIRLHGWFGPVGRVEHVATPTPGTRGNGERWVRIGFSGGAFLDLPGNRPCWVVELRG